MASEKPNASWAITIAHLAEARFYLPQRLGSEQAQKIYAQFSEYLDLNELDLALDEAESLGSVCNAPPAFWRELQLAAANLHMTDSEARFAALAAG
ncbi:MAG: hypothetical protein V4634_00090 [Pseudomonadota bacterium]